MGYWLTSDEIYYEADAPFHRHDIPVTKRPGDNYEYVDGKWYVKGVQDQEVMVHRVRLGPNPARVHQNFDQYHYDDPDRYNQRMMPPPPPPQKDDKKDELVLNNATKVMFGIKEIMVVGAFIVTATISWQDTNSRIVKLENNKDIEVINARIKSIETDIKDMDKQGRNDVHRLEQAIGDLSNTVFTFSKTQMHNKK